MGLSGAGVFQAGGTTRAKTPRQDCVTSVARAERARWRVAGGKESCGMRDCHTRPTSHCEDFGFYSE